MVVIALVLMAVLSLTNLFGIPLSGLAVLIGVALFFISRRREKLSKFESGLDIRSIGSHIKHYKLWILIFMPVAMNFLAIFISQLILPEYLNHIVSRTSAVLSFDKLDTLFVQLFVFALGEEIAWRGFFQKRLKGFVPAAPSILIASILFSISHIASGNTEIVVFDLFFIFINSIFYGIIFEKTNNAWVNAISHFLANLSGVAIIILLTM